MKFSALKFPCYLLALFSIFLLAWPAGAAGKLTIGAGAGYRRPVDELAAAFRKQAGLEVNLVYGNMGRVIAQIKSGGVVDIFLGEKSFLAASGLKTTRVTELGRGRLVLAYPKGAKITSPKDLADPNIKRVAVPDPKKAIYGKAGMEFLANSGLLPSVKAKLLTVGTVPQVSTYLLSGEIDAGFLNLTDVLGLSSRIGGFLKLDEKMYSPLIIQAAQLADAPNPEPAGRFLDFLATDQARKIVTAHGL